MDPQHDVDDKQFLMDMIAYGSGAPANIEDVDANEEAIDGSNTDVYLNMSGDGIEQSGDDDAADEEANVYIITQQSFYFNQISNDY